MACPNPRLDHPKVIHVVLDVHGDADQTKHRAFIHSVALQTFRGAKLFHGDGRKHQTQPGIALLVFGQLELTFAAGQHGMIQLIHRLRLSRAVAIFVIGAFGTHHPKFLDVVRHAQTLDEKRPTSRITDDTFATHLDVHQGVHAIDETICHSCGARLCRLHLTFLKVVDQPLLSCQKKHQQQTLDEQLHFPLNAQVAPIIRNFFHLKALSGTVSLDSDDCGATGQVQG